MQNYTDTMQSIDKLLDKYRSLAFSQCDDLFPCKPYGHHPETAARRLREREKGNHRALNFLSSKLNQDRYYGISDAMDAAKINYETALKLIKYAHKKKLITLMPGRYGGRRNPIAFKWKKQINEKE